MVIESSSSESSADEGHGSTHLGKSQKPAPWMVFVNILDGISSLKQQSISRT